MNEIQSEQVARLERALARERLARKEAERLLEARALELYQANVQLVELNRDLEEKVAKRAAEIETQRSFYQSILHQVPAEIVVLDREYRFVFVSESAVPDPQLRQWLHGKTDFDYCDYRGLDRQQAEERQSRFREVEENAGLWSGRNTESAAPGKSTSCGAFFRCMAPKGSWNTL